MLRNPGGFALVTQWRERWGLLKKSVQHQAVLQTLRRYATTAQPLPLSTATDAEAPLSIQKQFFVLQAI